MKTIIKNGLVVTSNHTIKADVVVHNGIITSITNEVIAQNGDELIDADGKYILPGGVDPHVHLGNPNSTDNIAIGTKAAAAGGTTTIMLMTGIENGESLLESVQTWKSKAKSSLIDYTFHPIIGQDDYNANTLSEIQHLVEQEGINSIKLFLAYKGRKMVDDSIVYKVLKKAGECGVLTTVHAENGNLIDEMVSEALEQENISPEYHAHTRPPLVEKEATTRVLNIAEVNNAPIYIVHVSCSEAIESVKQSKERGVKSIAETCPHYLILDEDYLKKPDLEGVKYVCSPPLRKKEHADALWDAMNQGLISTVGSDHCSYSFAERKAKGKNNFSQIPNGMPGIEDRFSLLYHYGVHQGKISLQKFVDIISTAPAKLFGLQNKGSITVGYDADIVILDPNRSKVISKKNQYQNIDYNPYEGIEINGVITHVLSRGETIFKDNWVSNEYGRGKFVNRGKFHFQF